MKGVILKCLADLVTEKFGKDKWVEALANAGIDGNSVFLATEDVADEKALKIVGSVCAVLNITLIQAADAFGDYWVNVFAPKIYQSYFRGANSARDFLLKMDDVHKATTDTIPNAHPPRFEYEWTGDKTLVMRYISKRGLIDFLVGLIKGVGKHYKENLTVRKLGPDKVQVVFSR
ncbi:MAG: heme NO-binding domain-containing protein [Nitrospiraceae bacterium]|nr:heme NO-binding domain-containing protein [Nitrospiraceae bacterium]